MKGLEIKFLIVVSFLFLLSSCGKNNPVSVAKPAAPTLSLPVNEATNQPVTATLTWSTVSNATSYHIQVSSSNTFSPIFMEDSSLVAATSTVNGLVNGTTYYWRVRAKNTGGVSDWTALWSFTVTNTPTLISPTNRAVNQPVTATLTWSTINNATAYHLQVSSSNDFLSIVADTSLTAATLAVPWLIDSTTYFWRVSAKNANGVSNWTDPWNFTTIKDTSFFEYGIATGQPLFSGGYWAAPDPTSETIWLYDFKGNLVIISAINTVVDTVAFTVTNDTVETYRGVFTLDSSITPNAMDIHLSTAQYKGQTIQTIYARQPVQGSFVQCYMMINEPGVPRPTYIPDQAANPNDPNLDYLLKLSYQWTH